MLARVSSNVAVHSPQSTSALPREFESRGPGHARVTESEGRASRMSRAYELMVIIDGDVEDPKAQQWIKTVTDGIVNAGGTIHGRPDWWGKRPFAYPIHKKGSGYYLVVQCLAEGGALDGLERSLRLADDIVRHKLIRLPDAEAARRGMTGAAA